MNNKSIPQTTPADKPLSFYELRAILSKYDFRMKEEEDFVILDYAHLKAVCVFNAGKVTTTDILAGAMKYLGIREG